MYRWLLFLFLFAFSLPAGAQERPFGLGIIIGDPTGISIKSWQNRTNAFDGGLAWSTDGEGTLQLHGDYLWHRFDLIDEPRTPLYYGLGLRLRTQGDDAGLGIRIPGGVAHLFANDPFEVFLEIVPVFVLVPDTELDVEGGIGVRYYFK